MEVRGLLYILLLPVPGAPALRLALAEVGDDMLPAPAAPPPPAALPENSSRGFTLVAVRVMRPDTAIGCDSLCCTETEQASEELRLLLMVAVLVVVSGALPDRI